MEEEIKHRKGILDYLDVGIGRLSDSDQSDGGRKRSFGVTFCVLMQIPAILYVLASAYAVVVHGLPVGKGKATMLITGGAWLSGFLSLLGFLVMLLRRQQDWNKLKGTIDSLVALKSRNPGEKSSVETQIAGALGHLIQKDSGPATRGGNPSQDLSEESKAEKLLGGG